VHPADVQDRDGAFQLLRRARRTFPFIERIFADGGYAGPKMALVAWRTGTWRLQIVKRSDAAGFEVLPKRWIVERTFAWISRIADWLAISSATPQPLPPSFVSL
jgi:transposase